MSTAATYDFAVDRGSDWSKVLTLRDNAGDPVPITDIFTTAISISGTTSPSVVSASLTFVSSELWSSDGNVSAPVSGTWIRVRRAGAAWEISHWIDGVQSSGYWLSDSNPNHPAWVDVWTAAGGATGQPVVDSDGVFFEGSLSLQERGPDFVPFEFDTVGDGTAGQVLISFSRYSTKFLSTRGTYRYDWFAYRGRTRSRLVAGKVTARGSSTGSATGIPVPPFGGSPTVSWGNIIGTLSNQLDLQAALDGLELPAGGTAANYLRGDRTWQTVDTNITTATGTNLTGYLYGNGTNIAGATAAAATSDPSTLVLRDALGASEFGGINTNGQVEFNGLDAGDSLTFNMVNYAYGAGAAAAHRTALGAIGSGDSVTFANATFSSGTITTSQPLALTQTWNNAAVTFTGWQVNITDTLSAASSMLMDLRVGGATKFSIRKDGRIFGDGPNPFINLSTAVGTQVGYGNAILNNGGNSLTFSVSGVEVFRINNQSICSLSNTGSLSWSSTSASNGVLDLLLTRDAANTLAQRNGTNAQVYRVYDTYSSATDYHRLAIATARATATAMSGASVTLTNIIPAGAVVVGVTCKVTTAITGATSFNIGTATDVDRFGAGIAASLGTTSDNRNWTDGNVECFPSSTSIILAANGGNFTAGAVYVSVQYLSGQAD